ncbi:hypothetical protein [Altererythrobacter aquiaggeris]|uniref:hypothetical protein n=1 Tax=Aestuarierythrobacter aquiaggeris TaxID=1898396 RepID=UPI003018E408
MKKFTPIALTAPLALALASCGSDKAEDTPAEAATPTAVAPATAELAPVGADARTTVAYDGTYSKTMADGTLRSITLNSADDTYSMIDGSGQPVTGTYNWYSDNSRILIKNGNETMVFAVADGAIYEMADADAAVTTANAENAYTRN